MKRWAGLVVAMLLAVGVTQLAGPAAQAAPGTLGGVVRLQEAGVTTSFAGVEVSLTPVGGGVAVSTTTDDGGVYLLNVEEGDYVLTAEPPDASGLTPSTRNVTVVAGENGAQDFLFTVVESRLRVSGTITDPSGAPVAGASVTFSGPSVDDGDAATTAGDGSYAVDVLPRTFNVFVNPSAISPFPERYSAVASLAVDSARTLDVQLPGSIVEIRVVDKNTRAPIDARIEVGVQGQGNVIGGQPTVLRSSFLDKPVAGGALDVLLVPGSGTVAVSADGYLPAPSTAIVVPTSTVTIELEPEPDPGITRITGRLLDRAGNPIAGSDILGERPGFLGVTAGDGSFDFEDDSTQSGVGRIEFRDGTPNPALPPVWDIRSSSIPHPDGGLVELGEIRLVDVQPVTFSIVDPDGVAVPNGFFDGGGFNLFPRVEATIGPYAAQATGRYLTDVVAGADGVLQLQLFDSAGQAAGRYSLGFDPPSGVDSCTFSRYNLRGATSTFVVDGPTSITVELRADSNDPFCAGQGPERTTVNAVVTLGGVAVDPTFVGFLDEGLNRTGTQADDTGAVTADLLPGTYGMDIIRVFPTDVWPRLELESDEPVVVIGDDGTVTPGGGEGGGDPLPSPDDGGLLVVPGLSALAGPFDLGTFDVPLRDLEVTVLTVDGRPIEGVSVSTVSNPTVSFTMNGVSFTGTSTFPGSPDTDANGRATLPLLPGGYTLRFTPPGQSFVPIESAAQVSDSGGGLQVQLAYPHDPPTATITPSGTSPAPDTFAGTATVTIDPVAFAGFDVASTEVTVDGGTPFLYTGPFPVADLGPHTVTAQVTDTGSVTGPPVTATFTIVEAPSDPPPISTTAPSTTSTSTTTTTAPSTTSTTTTTTTTTTTSTTTTSTTTAPPPTSTTAPPTTAAPTSTIAPPPTTAAPTTTLAPPTTPAPPSSTMPPPSDDGPPPSTDPPPADDASPTADDASPPTSPAPTTAPAAPPGVSGDGVAAPASSGGQQLPPTGSTGVIAWLATLLVLAGAALYLAGRRPESSVGA